MVINKKDQFYSKRNEFGKLLLENNQLQKYIKEHTI